MIPGLNDSIKENNLAYRKTDDKVAIELGKSWLFRKTVYVVRMIVTTRSTRKVPLDCRWKSDQNNQ